MTEVPFRDRTRATKHQKKLPLPPNFGDVLKEYTRAVLQHQPADILAWSAEYFKQLALESDPMTAQQPPAEHFAPSIDNHETELEAMNIAKVFASMDDSNTGYLYVHLVKRALHEALGLTRAQALYILSSDYVAVNDEGMLEYRQFARDCVDAVLFFHQSNFEFPEVHHVDDAPTVHGMVRGELQDEMLRVMRKADTEGLGRLLYSQYRDALINAPLQLTRRDISVLCAEAERTSDGYVEFKKEVENAFGLLFLSQSFTAFDENQSS
jgi:hypothetical protein